MGQTDFALRGNLAVPFRANWYDNSGVGNTFLPGISYAGGGVTGDLGTTLGTGNGNGGMIRLTRPFYGDIISAQITLQATTPVLSPTTIRFFKGDFDTDGVTAITSYSADRKTTDWFKISGFSAALDYGSQDNVFIDGMDISYIIPRRGDSDFNEDGFILGVELVNRDPTDWYLYNFKIDCLVQLGEQFNGRG